MPSRVARDRDQPRLIAFGEVEPASQQQIERCLDAAGESSRGVLCADHHKGYSMPIGGVVASSDVVMPAGVGYDIGCGNAAVQTGLKAADVDVTRRRKVLGLLAAAPALVGSAAAQSDE